MSGPDLADVPAIIERYTWELGTDLSSWESRMRLVAADVLPRQEAMAVAVACLLVALNGNDDMDTRLFWREHFPRLLRDVWGSTPLAASARNVLFRIGLNADAKESNEQEFSTT